MESLEYFSTLLDRKSASSPHAGLELDTPGSRANVGSSGGGSSVCWPPVPYMGSLR